MVFFPVRSLGLASAALFKPDLDTFAIRAKAGFGVGALSPLLGREAPLTAQLTGSLLPHSSSRAATSSPWVGFGGYYASSASFAAHLVSAIRSPTAQRSAMGAQRRRGS